MELKTIGFIGAGKVACSMGKYLKEQGFPISGYYSRTDESALAAAQFTESACYPALNELMNASGTLFIATGDDAVPAVWDHMKALSGSDRTLLHSKIICHFSGSLSSDVFSSAEFHIHAASVHPMMAFPDKFHSWEQLRTAFFTLEGDEAALAFFSTMFQKTGNHFSVIPADKKGLYHTAASMVSNQVLALLDIGLSLFMECGFSREAAYQACSPLILNNVEHILAGGTMSALTGPVERCDITTVKKHLDSLENRTWNDREKILTIYRLLGERLVQISEKKHPERDFSEIKTLLGGLL